MKSTPPPIRLYNRREAAEATRLSLRTIDTATKSGKLGYLRVGNGRGRILFRDCDIETYLARHAVPAREYSGAI